jgi:site-specific recombinase XerD
MRGLSENTQDSYARYVRKFLEFCSKTVQEIDDTAFLKEVSKIN